MNLSPSPFAFLIFIEHLGNSRARPSWVGWRGNCVICLKRTQAPDDIFCHNYSRSRPGSTVCQFNSCAECYRDSGFLDFPINKHLNDESEKFRRRKESATKYLVARDGDWLMAPFQCDNCWFFNLCKREPCKFKRDDTKLLNLIRRANLDMFWSREASTVQENLSRVKEIIRRWSTRGSYTPLNELDTWESRG